jgi:hypothetical protein
MEASADSNTLATSEATATIPEPSALTIEAALTMMSGYYISQALYVTAKLGIADLVRDRPRSVDDLARETGTHPRSLYRVLRTLAAVDVFSEDERGVFGITEASATLLSGVPWSLRASCISHGEEIYRAFGDMLHSVRTGGSAFEHVYGVGHFDYLQGHPEAAEQFNDAMAAITDTECAATIEAYDFSGFGTLVDIGGGNGRLLAEILAAHPGPSAVLFDLPHSLETAEERLRAAGLIDRCRLVGGSFFESVPAGGDLYVLKHIIHDWDDERAVAILKSVRTAITPDAKLILIEHVIVPGNDLSSIPAKMIDLVMLTVHGGHERTEEEFRRLLDQAGFNLTSVILTSAAVSVLEAVPV